MLKFLKMMTLSAIIVLLLVCGGVVFLFRSEIVSLLSVDQMDSSPFYSMTYSGDYGFDEFLKVGAESDDEIERFVTRRLLKGVGLNLGNMEGGCTAFSAKTQEGEAVLGRNFDSANGSVLQLKTTPDDGFASISTVDLNYAGYTAEALPKGLSPDLIPILAAPYLPFDGLNEKGVAIALLTVPKAQPPVDSGKITLNTTTAIRLVLDKAASVDEAVSLLSDYNLYFSSGINCHYLISDSTGKSVLVEFWKGKLQTVEPSESYQVASNFVAYDGLKLGEGFDEFQRYEKVTTTLESGGGKISEDNAISLLGQTGASGRVEQQLQWSVLYNLQELGGKIFVHGDTKNIWTFLLGWK